jgi:hypothetical protein
MAVKGDAKPLPTLVVVLNVLLLRHQGIEDSKWTEEMLRIAEISSFHILLARCHEPKEPVQAHEGNGDHRPDCTYKLGRLLRIISIERGNNGEDSCQKTRSDVSK